MKSVALLLVSLSMVVSCTKETTTYGANFERGKFWEMKLLTGIDEAVESLGLPIRAWLYFTDNDPSHQSREIAPLTKQGLLESSRTPSSYLVFYYSVQGNPRRDYIRCELYFVRGRLEKKLEALVTE